MVLNGDRSTGLRHTGRHTLVLDHVRLAFKCGDAVLHGYREMVRIDLRPGKFCADSAFNLRIRNRAGSNCNSPRTRRHRSRLTQPRNGGGKDQQTNNFYHST